MIDLLRVDQLARWRSGAMSILGEAGIGHLRPAVAVAVFVGAVGLELSAWLDGDGGRVVIDVIARNSDDPIGNQRHSIVCKHRTLDIGGASRVDDNRAVAIAQN